MQISISLVEVRGSHGNTDSVQRSIVPVSSPPAQSAGTTMTEKDDLSAIKAGLRKVKIFTEYVSSRKSQKASRGEEGSDGKCSRSEDSTPNYPLDSDSLDDFEGDSDEGKEDSSSAGNSISYGTLAFANAGGSLFYSNARMNSDDGDWVYYSYRIPDAGGLQMEDSTASSSEPYLLQSTKRSILPWRRKRKLSFRSPKGHREVPLLNKAYAEDGGDDIDFDRRQLSSDESFSSKVTKNYFLLVYQVINPILFPTLWSSFTFITVLGQPSFIGLVEIVN